VPRVAASRMHLIAEKLVPRKQAQLSLFDGPASRAEAVARVKREMNDRIGRFALRSGATLPLTAINRDTSTSWDICDVKGKLCF
jgi:DNA polymerase V